MVAGARTALAARSDAQAGVKPQRAAVARMSRGLVGEESLQAFAAKAGALVLCILTHLRGRGGVVRVLLLAGCRQCERGPAYTKCELPSPPARVINGNLGLHDAKLVHGLFLERHQPRALLQTKAKERHESKAPA